MTNDDDVEYPNTDISFFLTAHPDDDDDDVLYVFPSHGYRASIPAKDW